MTQQARLLAEWAALMALVLTTVLLATEYLAVPRIVTGASMQPTLFPGDLVLVDRWTYQHRPPRRGEVVLLQSPDGTPLVKRVAGDAADDGFRVLGDNLPASTDSRHFGPVPKSAIHGRVIFRYWPPARTGPIH